MRYNSRVSWAWAAALLATLVFAGAADAQILFQDDLEGQPAGTGNAPIAGQDLDPVNPPPVGIQWNVAYEGYPTDVPTAVQVINGDDRLGEDSDNCLYCSRPTGIGTIHVEAIFEEVQTGLIRTDLRLLNVLGAGLAYVGGYPSDGPPLFTLKLDQNGGIEYYLDGYKGTGATYTVGEWQDMTVITDLDTEQMTVSVEGGPPSAPFGFWTETSYSKVVFQGANGTEYFVDDLSVTVIPEPSSLVLILLGAAGLLFYGRRRR